MDDAARVRADGGAELVAQGHQAEHRAGRAAPEENCRERRGRCHRGEVHDPERDGEGEEQHGIAGEDQEDQRHRPSRVDPAEQPPEPQAIPDRPRCHREDHVDQ